MLCTMDYKFSYELAEENIIPTFLKDFYHCHDHALFFCYVELNEVVALSPQISSLFGINDLFCLFTWLQFLQFYKISCTAHQIFAFVAILS